MLRRNTSQMKKSFSKFNNYSKGADDYVLSKYEQSNIKPVQDFDTTTNSKNQIALPTSNITTRTGRIVKPRNVLDL